MLFSTAHAVVPDGVLVPFFDAERLRWFKPSC